MPGAAIERKHHHFCGRVILASIELDQLDVGMCEVCGRYLFISTDENRTVYRVATQREEELILALVNARAQIARMRNDK